MIRTTVRRKRPNPKRTTPRRIHSERSGGHQRIRLYGAAREKRRAEIFERAGGRCEEQVWNVQGMQGVYQWGFYRCRNYATEWSHKRHGANKCDCMDCGIASCRECHARRHNNPKPCPRKPKMEAK